MAKWKKNNSLGELQNSITNTITKTQNGNQFTDFDILMLRNIMYSSVEFEEPIPELTGRKIIWEALNIIKTKRRLSNKLLLEEISKSESNYLAKPKQRIIVTATISLEIPEDLSTIHFGRAQIIFEKCLPSRFFEYQKKLLPIAKKSLFAEPPKNYSSVRIHVTARTIEEAFYQASEHLESIRSIWNLYINTTNPRFFRLPLNVKQKPINKIVLGPLFFFHKTSGKLFTQNNYVCTPDYVTQIANHKFTDYSDIKKFSSDVQSQLSKSQYKYDLSQAIIRYSKALDERSPENAFLQLWGVLEKITGTVKKTHDETVERASYPYSDYLHRRLILNELKNYRNRAVHTNIENSEVPEYLYQLKIIVEHHLLNNIRNPFNFSSFDDAYFMFGLPHNKKALEERIPKSERETRLTKIALQHFSRNFP